MICVRVTLPLQLMMMLMYTLQTGVEVLSEDENSIIDLCESMLDSNCTLAESIVPEDSITLSETFLPTSCEFVCIDVEDIVVNLPEASDVMQV